MEPMSNIKCRLSQKDEASIKKIYEDDPKKKDAFVKLCVEIVERDLFKDI